MAVVNQKNISTSSLAADTNTSDSGNRSTVNTNNNQTVYNPGSGAMNEFAAEVPGANTSNSPIKMDDNGTSSKTVDSIISDYEAKALEKGEIDARDLLTGAFHSANLYTSNELNYYDKRYRYGILSPGDALSNCREYLFFTKPDLNIYPRDNDNGTPSMNLNSSLQSKPYWVELANKYLGVIRCLQASLTTDPFNHLLENMVQNNLEVPSMTAEMIETPSNMYGVNYTYRGSSEASDDGYDFSLEFKDTKYLPVYHFFRAYEDYETLKHHGVLEPWRPYITDKILYDQYAIYKFLVGEDGETIVYYAKYYGVKSKSLPRDTFSNTNWDNGVSYSIDFNAAFFDDMKPTIIKAFNKSSEATYNACRYRVDIHNHLLDRPDNRAVKAAYVIKEKSPQSPGGWVYKLKWRGDDEI